MNYSITQNGQVLDTALYTIDLKTKVFSSNEGNLILDFNGLNGWIFKTGAHCTFNTGAHCTFNTGACCIFKTGDHCMFNTGSHCTFDTGDHCTFDTGFDCTLNTGSNCTLNTGHNCKFNTVFNCIFSIYGLSTCRFEYKGDCNTLIDMEVRKVYILNQNWLKMNKISHIK